MLRFPPSGLLLICLLFSTVCEAEFTLDLNQGWSFRETNVNGPTAFMPATVPGTVHTDLFANARIPDPFLRTNETSLQWIETKTWEYQASFTCTRAMRKEKHIELQFDGLDTYADVYLNDSLLFTAEDMFLSYTKDVRKFIRAKNTLRIVFHPASELIEKNKLLSPVKTYPGGDRVFIRKAQYQFGWDWGPRFVTCGIWKPVRLVGWSGFRVSDVVYKLEYLDKDTAFMMADFMFEADRPGKYDFLILNGDSGLYGDQYSYIATSAEHLKITFKIPHPKLWWCNGLGEPNLYTFTLLAKNKKKKSAITTQTGIRKIEVSSDRMDYDGGFYFLLNDVPVFAKGANWIPPDNFLPRVSRTKTSAQLQDIHDLNMNMVRVWGGGVYESDHFYSKCDSLGLMVWQDLMFACSMYPYKTLDRNNLLVKEVIDNQRRIASHPSIALWCGDNENKEGWYNWGWQKQFNYSADDSAAIINEYHEYHVKFLGCLKLTDPFFPYIMSSPQYGWGRKEAYLRGDVHYWGVWWGMEPFTAYNTHTGRFVSEFGFQGMPGIHTLHEMGYQQMGWSSWRADSTLMLHQKHPTGYETISTYMERDYGLSPEALEDYIYLSQVMQRDALTTAIEAQRRNIPHCMGSLFWQYNDCWPVTSWSVQDFYGRKKLSWYGLKRAYAPILLSIEETKDSVLVWLVNESPDEIHGDVIVAWSDFMNVISFRDTVHADVDVATSVMIAGYTKNEFFRTLKAGNGYASATLSGADIVRTPVTTVTRTFGKAIDQNFGNGEIKHSFVRYITEGPCTVNLTSKVYQQNVMLICDDPDAEFSTNGFDLLPGQSMQVEVKTKDAALVEKSLRIMTLNRIVADEKKKMKPDTED